MTLVTSEYRQILIKLLFLKFGKEANLNQREFGDKLHLTRSSISKIESGQRDYTERTLSDVCELFNINYDWLITGQGDIHKETADSALLLLQKEYELDDLDIELVKGYVQLSPIERNVFKEVYLRST